MDQTYQEYQMVLIEANKQLLSSKQNHMKHAIKYRKVVRKIISLINIPEVLYKFIFNYVGSKPFPMNLYFRRPHSFPKNNSLFHHKTLEETNDQAQ
jgi:hypothetical protein